MGKRFLLRQCERSHFFLRFLMFFVCRNQGMAVNVDQVLQDLAATLEAAVSTKYNNALSYLSPGNLDTNSDALKSYILGATSMAVNFLKPCRDHRYPHQNDLVASL